MRETHKKACINSTASTHLILGVSNSQGIHDVYSQQISQKDIRAAQRISLTSASYFSEYAAEYISDFWTSGISEDRHAHAFAEYFPRAHECRKSYSMTAPSNSCNHLTFTSSRLELTWLASISSVRNRVAGVVKRVDHALVFGARCVLQ